MQNWPAEPWQMASLHAVVVILVTVFEVLRKAVLSLK